MLLGIFYRVLEIEKSDHGDQIINVSFFKKRDLEEVLQIVLNSEVFSMGRGVMVKKQCLPWALEMGGSVAYEPCN